MNREILEYNVFQWLLSLNLVKQNNVVKVNNNNKYELDEEISRQLLNGVKFGELLKQLLNITQNQEVKTQQYKDTIYKEDRIQNWNLNEQYLRDYGLPLKDEQRKEINRGDHQKSNILLKNLLQFSLKKLQTIIDQKKQNQQQEILNQQFYDEELQIRQQNPKNLFDFILFSLKSELNLQTHEQVIALMAENNKFLSKIIILGIKKDYTNVIGWFKYLNDNQKQIFEFLQLDSSNLGLFLDLLKHSLISKESQVSSLGLQIFLSILLNNSQFKDQFQDWFLDNNILQMSLSCSQKYYKLHKSIMMFIPLVGEKVLYSIQNQDRYQYLSIINQVFVGFSKNQQCCINMHKINFISILLTQTIQQLESDILEKNFRLITMTLLQNIWAYHFEKLHQNQQNQIFNLLKKCIRTKFMVLQIHGIQCLISLLDHFAQFKSQNAPYIYKTLVFFLIEMHEDLTIRQLLLANFKSLFQKFHQMPIQILINPLVKQIQEGRHKTYLLNTFDIDFFKSIIDHPEFSVQSAINLYDFFLQIYITDIRWSFSILDIFVLIEQFFQKEDQFLKKLNSILQDILLILFKQEKTKLKKEINDKKLIDGQKRNLLLVFIKNLANQNLQLNIIPKIVKYYQILSSLKKANQQNIFKKILSFFGDPENLINTNQKQDFLDKTQKSLKNQAFKNQEVISDLSFHSGQNDDYNFPIIESQLNNNQKHRLPKIINNSVNDGQLSLEKNINYFKKQNQSFIKSIQKHQLEQGHKLTYQEYIKVQKGIPIKSIEIKSEREKSFQINDINLRQNEIKSARSAISQNKAIKEKQNKMVQKLLPLQDWEFLLPLDIQSQNLILQKYQTYIKHLFNRYSSSKSVPDNIQQISFDQINQFTGKVYPGEIFRLVKELDWAKYILKEVFQKFIQFVNIKLSGKTLMTYDLKQFEQVLLYLSVFLLSNEPFSQSHLPFGKQLEIMLQQLYKNLSKKEEQDEKFINLFQNENIVIKKKDEKVEFILLSDNNLPESLKTQIKNKNYIDCYEIINSILTNCLQLQLIENLFNIQQNNKPLSPKTVKERTPLKFITDQSSIILGRKNKYKIKVQSDTKSVASMNKSHIQESLNLENLNTFAKQRLKQIEEEESIEKIKNQKFQQRSKKIKEIVQEKPDVINSIKKHEQEKKRDEQRKREDEKKKYDEYTNYLKSQKEEIDKFLNEKLEKDQFKKQQKKEKKEKEIQQLNEYQKKIEPIVSDYRNKKEEKNKKKEEQKLEYQRAEKEKAQQYIEDLQIKQEKNQKLLEEYQKKKDEKLKQQKKQQDEKIQQDQEKEKLEREKFIEKSERTKRKLEQLRIQKLNQISFQKN